MKIAPIFKKIGFGLLALTLFLVTFLKAEPYLKTYTTVHEEMAVVFEKSYSPEINQTSTGVGVSSGGGSVITTSFHHEPEKFFVFFKCSLHGVVFPVEDKELWLSLKTGDSTSIAYKETYNRLGQFKKYKH